MFCHRLRTARKDMNLTLEQLADIYNSKYSGKLSKGTLSKYENGKQEPMMNVVAKLSVILNVSIDYLLGKTNAKEAFEKFDKKASPPQQIIEKLDKEVGTLVTKIPLYNILVSAGNGQWLSDGHEYDFVYMEDMLQDADFALKVRGDSMEPMYSDDDIVLVKSNVLVESGQIGVFFLNGEGYMKMLQGNKLVSLNPNYTPIVINEWDSFFCAGRVICKATNATNDN